MSRLLDIFAQQVSPEQERFDAAEAEAMRKLPPKARSEYLIAFTPRSGSSWLTTLLTHTGLAGRPEEWLNPGHLPGILKTHPCKDLTSYVRRIRRLMLSRKRRTFGIECSWFQWRLYLEANQQKILPFAFDQHIYWTRRDLLGQALSLYKATETGHFHSVSGKSFASPMPVVPDDGSLWNWFLHIYQQEYGWTQYFRRRNIVPLALCYEDLWSDTPLTLTRLLSAIAPELPPETVIQAARAAKSNHQKMDDTITRDFKLAFYARYRDEIEFCIANRGQYSEQDIRTRLTLPPAQTQPPTGAVSVVRKTEKPWPPVFDGSPGFEVDTGTHEVVTRILKAQAEQKPLSIIRLGDGDATVIGYPEFTPESEFEYFLKRNFGQHGLDENQKQDYVRRVRQAVTAADVVGVVSGSEMTRFTLVRYLMAFFGLAKPDVAITHLSLHRHLQEKNLYHRLLSGQARVGLITCRDVADQVRHRFNINQVICYPVPEQAHFAASESVVARHFPDRFDALYQSLQVPQPGMLFLVGAGPLGKVYCQWVKERGGIALDIGSIFDAWAGISTRRYMRNETGGLNAIYRLD
jgi:LPS sulfotransferase NodH